MNTGIFTAVFSGAVSVFVALIGVWSSHNRILTELQKHNAVQDERIERLTEEVRRHNQLIDRTYRLESRMSALEARRENTGKGGRSEWNTEKSFGTS